MTENAGRHLLHHWDRDGDDASVMPIGSSAIIVNVPVGGRSLLIALPEHPQAIGFASRCPSSSALRLCSQRPRREQSP